MGRKPVTNDIKEVKKRRGALKRSADKLEKERAGIAERRAAVNDTVQELAQLQAQETNLRATMGDRAAAGESIDALVDELLQVRSKAEIIAAKLESLEAAAQLANEALVKAERSHKEKTALVVWDEAVVRMGVIQGLRENLAEEAAALRQAANTMSALVGNPRVHGGEEETEGEILLRNQAPHFRAVANRLRDAEKKLHSYFQKHTHEWGLEDERVPLQVSPADDLDFLPSDAKKAVQAAMEVAGVEISKPDESGRIPQDILDKINENQFLRPMEGDDEEGTGAFE